jgi:hypothetical protein
VIRQWIQKKHWWMLQGLVLWSQTLVALATDFKEDHAPTFLKTHCGYQLGGFVVMASLGSMAAHTKKDKTNAAYAL